MTHTRLQHSETDMRALGYRVVDQLVDHLCALDNKKPVCRASRGDMDALLSGDFSMDADDPVSVIDHVVNDVLANCSIPAHPKAFAFVPGPGNYISNLADFLASGFNVFTGSWMAAPAASSVEIKLINWLLQRFELPVKEGGGTFTSGGSMANLTAIVTARRVRCGEDFSTAVVYLSDQAHSSNIKALSILGFRKSQIRIVPTDELFRLDMERLEKSLFSDKRAGLNPLMIIASAGTTNTGAVDPLDALADLCAGDDIWLHVDAAYGGAGVLSDNNKSLFNGISRAHSVTVDPHKWFFQPYEIGCLLVRDRYWLSDTFTETPEYLQDVEGNSSEINFYDHGVQLTRNFKALKLYMSLKTYGVEAFSGAVTYNIELTERVEEYLRSSSTWEIVTTASLAVINFRYNPLHKPLDDQTLDQINEGISRNLMDSGQAMVTTTTLRRRRVLRLCLINPRTKFEDVQGVIDAGERYARCVLTELDD
ncbi:MAG: aminotransferase class V-fold PLP-dependent enzyme [Pseudomonadota bacterium]